MSVPVNPENPVHSRLRIISRVLMVVVSIYLIWAAGSLLMQLIGVLFAQYLQSAGIHLLSVFFFIVLASLSTAVFLVYAEPVLKGRDRLRMGFIFGAFFLTVVFILHGRMVDSGPTHAVHILNSANLLVFANLVGTWLVSPLKRSSELVPVCMAVTLADMFSVFKGPSRDIAASIKSYYETGISEPPPVVDFILLKITIPGVNNMPPVFGVSDWIVVAFLAAAAVRFGFNDNMVGKSVEKMVSSSIPGVYLPVSALGLFSAVLLAWYFGLFLPALPVIVFFFMGYILIRYPEARRLSSSDWIMTLAAVLMIIAVMLVLEVVPIF